MPLIQTSSLKTEALASLRLSLYLPGPSTFQSIISIHDSLSYLQILALPMTKQVAYFTNPLSPAYKMELVHFSYNVERIHV